MAEKKKRTRFEKDVARRASASRSRRAEVNVGEIAAHTKNGETVAVPGKVLGGGSISHSVTVAALSFSSEARAKIEKAGGKAMPLTELSGKARIFA
jgi:large subunit ribosomal protein L18e